MRKTILVFCLAFSLVVFAGCGKKEEIKNEVNKTDKQTEEKFGGTFRDLMKKGDAIKCENKVTTEGFEQKNIIYISGEKMRMDAETKIVGQKEMVNHMISIDGYSYTWGEDGSGKGMKFKSENEDKVNQEDFEGMQDQSLKMDFDTAVDMNCDKWKEDKNMFIPPSNIIFDDFSEMMKEFQNYGEMEY